MSRVASLPRAVGWVIVAAAPLAAALVAVGTSSRRSRGTAARRRITDVPTRPPLWDSRPKVPVVRAASLHDVPPVPPENNHAPPTPALGIPRQA
jgi:hypothetical protein